MKYRIRVRLAELNLKFVFLVDELRKMGERIGPSELSGYVCGRALGPKSERILAECDEILRREERRVYGAEDKTEAE